MTEQILLTILLVHFLSDFGLQTHEQAINKSSSDTQLTYHVAIYSFIWLIAANLYLSFISALGFAIITFIAHWITDYITSRISKEYFAKQDMHNGFVVVGADQMLHYIQLYFTFKLLL